MNTRRSEANPGECSQNRRNLLKIPVITTGFMLGAMAIPPLTQTADAASGAFDTKVEGAVRIGFWNLSLPVPAFFINRELGAGIKRARKKVRQFSSEKRAVHHYAVRELPRQGEPLALESIARDLEMPLEKVSRLVDELEQAKTFLFRKNSDRIDWAYPVTVDATPHKVTFSTGEQVNAAWAIDAIATPFVQGKLQNRPISFIIESQCAHSGRPLRIEIDSDLNVHSVDAGADPFIFVPGIDLGNIKQDSIIELFWRRSVFFWSEENAKAYRKKQGDVMGAYLTLKQSIALTAPVQGAMFGFF